MSMQKGWVAAIVIGLVALMVGDAFYHRLVASADTGRQEIQTLRLENQRLRDKVNMLSARLEREARALTQTQTAIAKPKHRYIPRLATDFEPGGVVEHVAELKGYLADHPEKSVPELRLLKDTDWIEELQGWNLDTEANRRAALAMMRQRADIRLGVMVGLAIKDFQKAHDGQPPNDPSELAAYLKTPADADLLRGFERITDETPVMHGFQGANLFQLRNNVDGWYDSMLYVGSDAYMTLESGPGWMVDNAITEFRKKDGVLPTDASQIVPFVKGPQNFTDIAAIFAGLQKSPGQPPIMPAMKWGGASGVASYVTDAPMPKLRH